jgi:hypothetical protein
MRRPRVRLSHSAARSDRGVLTIMGILIGALVTMATVAAVAAAVVLHQRSAENPGGFAVMVTKSTAVRDAHDLPVVVISYRVNFKTAAAAKAQIWPVHVQCRMDELAAGARGFQHDEGVMSSEVFYFGEAVIAPGERDKDIEGPFKIQCWLRYHGATLDYSKGADVDVPKPSAAQGGAGDISDVKGVYPLTLVRQSGSESDCVLDGERSFTVTPLNDATIRVELSEQDSFEAKLGADLRFSGSIALNPGFRDYFGVMDGQFVPGTGPTRLTGTVTTQTPACTFSYDGVRKDG